MLDYIWSISDEALRDGRNQPPKPQCLSASATFAFVCVALSQSRPGGDRRIDGVRFENVQSEYLLVGQKHGISGRPFAHREERSIAMFNLQWSLSSRRRRPLELLLGLGLVVNRSGSDSDGKQSHFAMFINGRHGLLADHLFAKKRPRRVAGASLGGLTNKAGMSFSFRGVMPAAPRSIKDQDKAFCRTGKTKTRA